MAGEDSDPSVALLRIQGFALVATFITVACGFALLSLHRHAVMLLANVLAVLTALVLTLVLIPPYEATGAAIAVLVAEVVLAVSVLVALVRARPNVARAVVRAPAVLVAGGAAALVALVPGVPPIADALVALAAYPALLVARPALPARGAPTRCGAARRVSRR